MRIAFIAPYQGPTLRERRPTVNNLSLGAKVKIETIVELLRRSSHDVEILSQGEVVEHKITHYPSFRELKPFADGVPVIYGSAFPVKGVNGFWSSASLLRLFKTRSQRSAYDLVMIYNLKAPQVACATYALARGVPVVLEYEDDHFLEIFEPNFSRFTSALRLRQAKKLLTQVSGCLAGSRDLLSQTSGVPTLLLPGVIDDMIIAASRETVGQRKNWVVFSGTHSRYQGLKSLISAWKGARPEGWELHIAGLGDQTDVLHELAAGDRSIFFHGVLTRRENARLLAQGKLAVVPYDVAKTRGFSFKTLECLGAGLHVITTRLTALEGLDQEVKNGLTYLDDNSPATISECLRRVVDQRIYERTSQEATIRHYGPDAVTRSLDRFLAEVSRVHAGLPRVN